MGKNNKIKNRYENMGFGFDVIYILSKGKLKNNYGEFNNDEDSEFRYDSNDNIIYDHYRWNIKMS